MKSCIWDEIQANQPAQTQLDRELETLEQDMEALAHAIAALQEEIEQDITDLQLIEFYLEGK
jgi:predicted  nucleic acid-binding Zn-ribbon protein